jgi:glycosyltransferase involved in cell wall biosynthesis
MLSQDLRLVLVGEGPARAEIEAAIPRNASAFVTLTGARPDVPALLSAMDLFVLPSRTEGLPLAIPEAMACALPVVATAVGGLPEVVTSDVGRLVPPLDEEALREAIAEMLSDETRLRRMGGAARRAAVERYSLERMTDAYEALYLGEP